MTDQKAINPFLKQVLELGPTLIFFFLYLRWRDETFAFAGVDYSGFIVATLAFLPVLLIAMGILWYLTGTLSRMQLFTIILVLISGALTAWFNDERFFKMKTTFVYGLFAVLLGIGLAQGKSYLALMLSEAVPMAQEGWMILTRRLTFMFTALAIGNELIWRNMSTDAWVKIETFIFPILLMAFLALQFVLLRSHLKEDQD